MWSDNETSVDLLGYHHLVGAVTSIIRDKKLLPATVGVFGDWGSGKSSLLQMVQSDIKDDTDLLVVSFNGWLFEGYEDAKSALMGVILDAIAENRTLGDNAKSLVSSLLRRVNWFRVAGTAAKHGAAFAIAGPAGLGLTVAADLAGYLKQITEKAGQTAADIDLEKLGDFIVDRSGQDSRRAVREFRDDFQALLNETKIQTLVVVIDDLDRCLPDTIIEILEGIKLFLFVPQTAFVIGADERLVRYAVRRRFPELPGDSAGVANEYLEKLIQYPVRIPPLDSAEVETYINLLFASVAPLLPGQFDTVRNHVVQGPGESLMSVRFNAGIAQELLNQVPDELKPQLAMAQRIAPVLASGLKGNPRQCKRFLNTLVMRLTMAKSRKLELQQRVLAKLMLLEYLKPEWFRRLAHLQAEDAGTPKVLAQLEQAAAPAIPPTETAPPPSATAKATPKDAKRPPSKVEPAPPPKQVAKSPATSPPLSREFESWLSDPWMKEWLLSEPQLSTIDLRPYFFFSRDHLGSLGAAVRSMSPVAQETLQKLLHDSEAQRNVAVRSASNLSPADAAAVFEGLVHRIEQHDDLRAENSPLLTLCQWAAARPELLGQTLSLFGRLPHDQLPLRLPLQVVEITKNSPAVASARQLLEQWQAVTDNKSLATTAANAIKRIEG